MNRRRVTRMNPAKARLDHHHQLFSLDENNSRLAPDALTVASLFYLALPTLIFLVGWLRSFASIPLLVLTLAGIWQFLRRDDVGWAMPYSTKAAALVMVVACLWASLGGAGHFFEANPDWLIRDKVLGDLTITPWPPAYSLVEGHWHILRTAFGFFLPAALIGKVFGIASVDIALYVYCAIGCSLYFLLLPLPRKAGWPLALVLLLPVFFSGMDYLGIVLVTGTTPLFPLRLEWWVPFSYPSMTGQMHWAPNHAIPIWLVTTLFYRHWGHASWPALFMVMLPLTVIWTPFAAAAMLPFLLLASWRWFALGNRYSDAGITISQTITAALITALTMRFISLDFAALPALPQVNSIANWTWDTDQIVLKYLLFILMEFAILALLLARGLHHSTGLFRLACIILMVLPLFKFGPSNDLILRLSTPCLVILLIVLLGQCRQWLATNQLPFTAFLIGVVFCIGAATPFNEMYRSMFFKRTAPDYSRSLVEQHWNTEPPHYVGILNSSILDGVMSAPTRVPTAAERSR